MSEGMREEAEAARAAVAAKLRASQQQQQQQQQQQPQAQGQRQGNAGRRLLHLAPAQWKNWEKAPQFGRRLRSAPLLPVRAPLSSLYEIHFSGTASLAPTALMEKLIASARSGAVVNVGAVVDATGEDFFLHDVKEWEDWDVDFIKLPGLFAEDDDKQACEDKEDAMVQAFADEIAKHLEGEKKDMDVAVYGSFNSGLPGFLIVSYLVECCGLNLDAALEEFAAASTPGIYSRYYLERLYRKYHSTLASDTATLVCPAPPKWGSSDTGASTGDIGPGILTEEDKQRKFVRKLVKPSAAPGKQEAVATPSSNGKAGGSGGLPAPPVYKPPMYIPPDRSDPRPAKRRKIRSWLDDVTPLNYGEAVDSSSEEHANLSKALEKLTGIEGFPGCETIPLTATHIADGAFKRKGCLTKSYLVTWRARGRRCLLYVAADGTYVVSRDMTFTKVDMKFPRRRVPAEHQVNTLIDGLIVEDHDHDKKVARYLAFDILFLEGTPIWQKKLEKRLQCLQNEIILPRKNDPSFDYAKEPFRVRMKDHFRLAKTEYLLKKFVSSVTHEVEGVIYTPTEAPYNLGGFESEEPIFKFVASEDVGIPGLDGSISERRLLQYIEAIPK